MHRWGSAAGAVAAMWGVHGLSPSETLDCPPLVLEAAMAIAQHKEQAAAREATAGRDREAYDRMHGALHGGS